MPSIITMKPVILPAQARANGSYNLKIRITYKRKSRLISTNITVPKEAVSRKGEIKSKDTLIKGYAIVSEMQRCIDNLPYGVVDNLDVDDIIKIIKNDKFSLDFVAYARSQIEKMSKGTRRVYLTSLNALIRFMGKDSFDISVFNTTMLKNFIDFIITEPKASSINNDSAKKNSTARLYLGYIRHLYRCAMDEFNDEDTGQIKIARDPFKKVRAPVTDPIKHRNMGINFIQKMISYKGECTDNQRMALDLYVMSFALMGMNAVDFYNAPYCEGDILTYNRTKTRTRRADKALMKVKIEPCIRPLIDKYRDPSKKRMFIFYKMYKTEVSFCTAIIGYLKYWADKNGIEGFTFYSARHSFASIARSSACNIRKDIVDECLCHVNNETKMADIYIEKDWTVLWDANKTVLSLFDWD